MGEGRGNSEENGFRIGDMVWGKVKTHPWWPGVIFNVGLASRLAHDTKKQGHLLVAFFGDATYKWLKPSMLISFDHHYIEKSKQTNEATFLLAVEEALAEVKRRAALGLTCHCREPSIFRPTSVQGFLEVDVSGYATGGVYSLKQIKKAREDFGPSRTLSCVKQLALNPRLDALDSIRNVARVLAYRKAVFNDIDETYAQAFGMQSKGSGDSVAIANESGSCTAQASLDGQPTKIKASGKVQLEREHSLSKREHDPKLSRTNYSGDHISRKRAPSTAEKTNVRKKNASTAFTPVTADKVSKTVDRKQLTVEARSGKSPAKTVPFVTTIEKNASELASKKRRRPDSPKQARKKTSACNNKKSLAAEEKPQKHKSVEVDGDNEMGTECRTLKKPETLTTAAGRTMLLMTFPSKNPIPSVSDLKLKFSRFPSLDKSDIRRYWNLSKCGLVFMSKEDARAAFAYAVREVFGREVMYELLDLKGSTSRFTESEETRKRNDAAVIAKVPPSKSFSTGGSTSVIDSQQAMENKNYQISNATASDADFSSRMLALLEVCAQHVAVVKNELGYVCSLCD